MVKMQMVNWTNSGVGTRESDFDFCAESGNIADFKWILSNKSSNMNRCCTGG